MHPVPPPETETPEQLHERARLWCLKHYEETGTCVDPVSGKRLPGVCLSKDPNREDRRRLRKFRGDPRIWKPVVGFEPTHTFPALCSFNCLSRFEHALMTGEEYVAAEHPSSPRVSGLEIGGRPVVEGEGFSWVAPDPKDNGIYEVAPVFKRRFQKPSGLSLFVFDHGGTVRQLSGGRVSDPVYLSEPAFWLTDEPRHPAIVESALAAYISAVEKTNTAPSSSVVEAIAAEDRAAEQYVKLHAEYPPEVPVRGRHLCDLKVSNG